MNPRVAVYFQRRTSNRIPYLSLRVCLRQAWQSGTLIAIPEQAGLTRDEFLKLLH